MPKGPKGERRKCQGPRTILLDRPRSSPFAEARISRVFKSGKELAKRFIACVSHDVTAAFGSSSASWQFGTASREPLEAAFRAFFSAFSFLIL
jgi:hypothetical protein